MQKGSKILNHASFISFIFSARAQPPLIDGYNVTILKGKIIFGYQENQHLHIGKFVSNV